MEVIEVDELKEVTVSTAAEKLFKKWKVKLSYATLGFKSNQIII